MASEEDTPQPVQTNDNGSTKPGPASVALPMSGVMKCVKEGSNNMLLSAEAKQAVHDAALVFISFVSTVSFERTKARKLKTMTADDVIAELHSLHFVDMAKSLASSVQDYRTRKSKKRQRDASSEAGDATSALPAAPNASSPPAAKAARNASTATAAPKRTTNSTSADLAGMWGQKVAVADTTPAVAPGVLPAASPPTGSQSEDEDALASQEQLAELAAAFSVDET